MAVVSEPELSEPVQLYPSDPIPELPYYDEDWFRFYYDPPVDEPANVQARVRYFEVHELTCTVHCCAFRPWEGCPFHPPGCECSEGACQIDGRVAPPTPWKGEWLFDLGRGDSWTVSREP